MSKTKKMVIGIVSIIAVVGTILTLSVTIESPYENIYISQDLAGLTYAMDDITDATVRAYSNGKNIRIAIGTPGKQVMLIDIPNENFVYLVQNQPEDLIKHKWTTEFSVIDYGDTSGISTEKELRAFKTRGYLFFNTVGIRDECGGLITLSPGTQKEILRKM